MYIKQINDIQKNPKGFGSKTINLVKLFDNNFNIPKFVALDNKTILKIKKNPLILKTIIEEISTKFPCQYYAVRSSALIEDGIKKSYAGQFMTKLKIDKYQLKSAINSIINQAEVFLEGDLSKFSILIQQFINPDYAGVLFTRNPEGTRDAVFEYFKGIGESLVSGKVKAEKIRFYWENNNVDFEVTNASKSFKQTFKEIEKIFNFPQDIEWCIKNGLLYILQSRPITTIKSKDFEKIKIIDKFVEEKKLQTYYFYKNEISQIIPRPCNLILDILDLIYGKNGPIEKVYKKYGIKYYPQKFWEIIGNELYINKNLEIKSILPAFKFDLIKSKESWDFSSINHIPTTLNNILKIISISPSKIPFNKFFTKVENIIYSDPEIPNINQAIHNFLKTYELIFEINLIFEKALKNLETMLQNESIDISTVLEGDIEKISSKLNSLEINPELVQGNSIDLLDKSKFEKVIFENKNDTEFETWFKELSEIKRKLYRKTIINAQNFNKLREVARWLTVISISHIRLNLENFTHKKNIKKSDLIYFATLREIKHNKLEIAELNERLQKYNLSCSFDLPKYISSQIKREELENEFISGKKLEGKIIDIENLYRFSKPRILKTHALNPSLTQYFKEIDGIISENGSLLSHLAIMAREKGIPVVVTDNINKYKVGNSIKLIK